MTRQFQPITTTNMRADITTAVAHSCNFTTQEAADELKNQVQYLNDVAKAGELNYATMEQACCDLGLDMDYIEDLIEMML